METHWEVRGFPRFQHASALRKATTVSFHISCGSLFIDCSVMQHDNPSTWKCGINKEPTKQFVACFGLSFYSLFASLQNMQSSIQKHTTNILIMKANEMHYLSHLFDKVLYMFQTSLLSIIKSISVLYIRNRFLSY